MKVILPIIVISMLFTNMGYAQQEDLEHEPIYLTFCSKVGDEETATEGVYRSELSHNMNPIYNGPTVFYSYYSKSRGMEAHFMYINFNEYELSKKRPLQWDDILEIREEPVSFLDNNQIINIEELFETMTLEDFWDFTDALEDKKVYIIDTNPEYKQVNLETVKLIQVVLSDNNRPINNVRTVN